MPLLPLVLGWVLLGAEPAHPAAAGYRPTGSPVELYDLGRLALLRDPGVRMVAFRPSERTRHEGGETVLAEADGPGILQRLWFGHLNDKGGRLKIYLDRQPRPVLDLPLADLFADKHPHFPRPLVGERPGGFVCYVPIAFRDGCKVVLDGTAPPPFQIDMLKLPGADGITTFTANRPQKRLTHSSSPGRSG